MDSQFHTMENLFMQLGLENDAVAIRRFVDTHRLHEDEAIENASFWTPAQSAFIYECLADDSDWAEVVDQLNSQLRL